MVCRACEQNKKSHFRVYEMENSNNVYKVIKNGVEKRKCAMFLSRKYKIYIIQ